MEKEFENKLMNLVNDEAVSKESIALTAMDFAKKSTLYKLGNIYARINELPKKDFEKRTPFVDGYFNAINEACNEISNYINELTK